jgi:hypothetical protein
MPTEVDQLAPDLHGGYVEEVTNGFRNNLLKGLVEPQASVLADVISLLPPVYSRERLQHLPRQSPQPTLSRLQEVLPGIGISCLQPPDPFGQLLSVAASHRASSRVVIGGTCCANSTCSHTGFPEALLDAELPGPKCRLPF